MFKLKIHHIMLKMDNIDLDQSWLINWQINTHKIPITTKILSSETTNKYNYINTRYLSPPVITTNNTDNFLSIWSDNINHKSYNKWVRVYLLTTTTTYLEKIQLHYCSGPEWLVCEYQSHTTYYMVMQLWTYINLIIIVVIWDHTSSTPPVATEMPTTSLSIVSPNSNNNSNITEILILILMTLHPHSTWFEPNWYSKYNHIK